MKRKLWFYILTIVSLLVLLMIILLGFSLANAKLELSHSGVHQRLLMPVGTGAYMAIRNYAGSGDQAFIPGYLDGPVVRRQGEDKWTASWYCEDRVYTQEGRGAKLDITCAGKQHQFPLGPAIAATQTQNELPARLVVLSDIEGNLTFLDAALKKMEIVDDQGNWRFANNQIIFVGDSVDRGRDTYAVLWRIYALSQQAHAAGGKVHMLLGNHEQYLLLGKLKSAHPEHVYSAQQLGGYTNIYASDTIIGDWLRKQTVIAKFGNVLFAHGGINPAFVQHTNSVEDINQTMWDYWQGKSTGKLSFDIVMAQTGVSRYRGYFSASSTDSPSAKTEDVRKVLKAFNASHIVVGHTIVDKISFLHDKGVIAVDVNDDQSAKELLVFEAGQPNIVSIDVPRNINAEKAGAKKIRPFNITESADRSVLWSLIKASYLQSKVPNPY